MLTPLWRLRLTQLQLLSNHSRAMSIVHDIAKTGFNTANEHYDKSRPSYQASALSYLRGEVKAAPPFNIVEIGAGTGLFTRALLAHPEWQSDVKQLRAVEPSEGMRSVFNKTISDERVSIIEGTFQETKIEDGWADLVVIAQAFHWCPDFEGASQEFGRILKPGGVLALIWNLEDREAAKWVAQVRDRIEVHEQGSPQYRHGLWRRAFDTAEYKRALSPPQEKTWAYSLPVSGDVVVDRALSKSYMAILSDEEKMKVRQDLEEIVKRGEGKVWMNEGEGIFEYPYKTDLVIARRV